MADRSVREFSTQAPAPYVGQFLQGGIFPYAQRFLQGQFANMGAPDSSPYTYTGPRVAQFDPRERRGMQMSDQAIGSYSPYLGSQSSLLGQATDYLRKGTGAGTELTGEAADLYRGAGRDFDPSAYKDYMSPYTDEVVDRSMGDIREQMEKQKMGARDRAVSSGAFGGSRGRLAEEDIERAGLRSMGDVSAGLREKGYGQSQQQAFQEFARRQAERGGTAQGLAGLGQQFYGMGLGSAGGLGSLGGQFGSMAPSLQNLQTGDINRTMQFGGLGRGRQQSLMDLGYQNFTGQYNLPMQTLQNVGALTASLGPMAGGYGYAGQGMPTEFAGGSAYQPAGGGIPAPGAGSYTPYSTGAGNYQPYTGQTQGQQQSNIGGGPQTQPLAPMSPTNYNTYGNNMPIRAAEGKPLTQDDGLTDFSQKIGEGIDNYAISPYLAEVGFFENHSFSKYVEGARLYNQNTKAPSVFKSAAPLMDDSFEALQDGYESFLKSFRSKRGLGSAMGARRAAGPAERATDLTRLLLGQQGREMSDKDSPLAFLLPDKGLSLANQGQTGKTLSDKDLESLRRAGGGGIRSLKYNG